MRTLTLGLIAIVTTGACTDGKLLFGRDLHPETEKNEAPSGPPIIASFTTNPTTLTSGAPTAVTWSWTFANNPSDPECVVDQGIGAIRNGSAHDATLSEDTNFTLSCTNSEGSDTARATITIEATQGTACGPDNCDGCCDAGGFCRDGASDDACGSFGSTCADCVLSRGSCESGECTNCEPDCSSRTCGEANGCGGTCKAGSGCCEPQCSTKVCGDSDGCGGICDATATDCCTPKCSDKYCGDPDGCDGSCKDGSGCCTPSCSGKLCGDADGCGGSCNTGAGCCTPKCSDKLCGAKDGCGGTCKSGSGCCTPKCSGKLCGAKDGCGGTCESGSGCCSPKCSNKLCGADDGCGGSCEAGSGCCTPKCSNKLCGADDGCGGTCDSDSGCCTPKCSNKLCGADDGCGGSCESGSGCCTPKCSNELCGADDGCGGSCDAGSGCCERKCTGKYCGEDDGCGGVCGSGSGCTACPTSPCDLVAQCGCASSQACTTTYDPDGATTCRAVTKDGKELDTCKSVEECAKGYLCMGLGNAWNRCKPFCNSDADCSGTRSICRAYGKGSVPNTNFCTSNCDPMSDKIGSTGAAGCPSGYQCFALTASDTGRSLSECAKIGTAGIKEACSSAADCSAGLNCIFYPSGGMCLQECRLSEPKTTCLAPTFCTPYNSKVVIAGVEYGYCAYP